MGQSGQRRIPPLPDLHAGWGSRILMLRIQVSSIAHRDGETPPGKAKRKAMNEFQAVFTIVTFFVVRFALPAVGI